MSNGTNPANGKTSKLVLILYIAAGVLGALFIYMFIYAINYINSYVTPLSESAMRMKYVMNNLITIQIVHIDK